MHTALKRCLFGVPTSDSIRYFGIPTVDRPATMPSPRGGTDDGAYLLAEGLNDLNAARHDASTKDHEPTTR